MRLLAIGLKTEVDLADCSRNLYKDKHFTAYNMSLYPVHPERDSSLSNSLSTKHSDGEKITRYSRRMELRRSCSKSAAEQKVLPNDSAGDGAGLKSEPGVAALFNEAQRLRVDRNHVYVFRKLAEGEQDISKHTLHPKKHPCRRQQQPPPWLSVGALRRPA